MKVSSKKLKSKVTWRTSNTKLSLDDDIKTKINMMTAEEKTVLRDRLRMVLNLHKKCP